MRKPKTPDELLLWLLIAICFELAIIVFVIMIALLFPAPTQLS